MASTVLVSVVMTARDVEEYVGDAVGSVLRQSLRDLELIVVDDGSTDGTPARLAAAAAADPRVRVVRTDGVGPGAARNHALSLATGELLTFVDGDDVLPADALERLVTALQEEDVDIAVGHVVRLDGETLVPSPAHERSVAHRVRRTHIDALPDLVYDSTAWNKVYRRALWTGGDLRFVEGHLYEDMPVVLQAHVEARAVTLVGEVTYHWRWRHDSSSITQRKEEEANLRDRVRALEHSLRLTDGHPSVRDALGAKIRTFDLLLYAVHAERSADAGYRRLYRTAVRRFVPWRALLTARDLTVEDRCAYVVTRLGGGRSAGAVRRALRGTRRLLGSAR